MSACPQCGTPAKATDKFCNSCGFLLNQAPAQGAPGGFGAPPPPAPGGFGAPPPPAPGGFGAPPPPAPGGFGAPPPPAPGGYGGPPQQGFGAPPPQQGFGAPPPQQGFGAPPPQQGFGAPPPQQGFGAPPPQQGFGAPPPQQGFGAPPPQQGFGAPPPQQGFGAPPPQQQGFGGPPPATPYGGSPAAKCQQGHEIPPGASFCAFGHPIAMQGMQINNDMYGSPQPPAPPPPAFGGGGYAPPPQAQGGFGAPPPPQPQPFGASPTEPAAPGAQQPSATAVRAFLISYQANANGDVWNLKGGRMTVGRANAGIDLDVPLSDATISSRHAALLVDSPSGNVTVEDTGSTNGTYVNEEHIGQNGRRDLKDGDRVRFGGFTTIIKIVGRV